VKVIDKTPARTTKRNAPAEAPASKTGVPTDRGTRRGGFNGNEGGKCSLSLQPKELGLQDWTSIADQLNQ
jgi:hypothetical protein